MYTDEQLGEIERDVWTICITYTWLVTVGWCWIEPVRREDVFEDWAVVVSAQSGKVRDFEFWKKYESYE